MVCFDYDEVTCSVCKRKTVDGYCEIDGKIVCDECRESLKRPTDRAASETMSDDARDRNQTL
jgi:hypothetical protein